MESTKVLLLDIEGTVCSISFVKDVLVSDIRIFCHHRQSDFSTLQYDFAMCMPTSPPPYRQAHAHTSCIERRCSHQTK